ncbi:cation-translocating P-type ATPase [Haliangium sp.]
MPDVHLEPHRHDIEQLRARLASSPDGLTDTEARVRLAHEGPNLLAEAPPPPLVLRFGRHLVQRFALLLWGGALLAMFGEHFSPGEGMALIAAALVTVVFFNAAFSFWQEMRVERAMAAFRGMLARRARVLRGGAEVEIDVADVVVGDVLVLREGDRVAADARLFEANALKVDNSPLTGESEPQLRMTRATTGARLDARNLVFSGTLVTTGTGAAYVYAIGNDTEIGRVAGVTRDTARVETPMRRELRHFISVISRIAVGLGALFFVTGWVIGNPFWTNLVFAVGIIVANVPEGLLPTVTLALAIAGRKMAARNALLKSLESAETLGSTTVICTDKTGTLTRNEMRVTDVLLGAEARPTSDDPAAAEQARLVMALCNNATLQGEGAAAVATGDPTETALLYHIEGRASGAVQDLRTAHRRVYERPFDSGTKEMATVHETPSGLVALLKGAPEVVVEQCTQMVDGEGAIAMGPEDAERFRQRSEEYARNGRRVLALACKSVGPDADLEEESTGGGYTLLGLVAMQDPPRAEVAVAVEQCRAAGIRVVVISGDHPLTVEAIARQVGIVRGEAATVYTGAEIQTWSKAALRHAVDAEEVLFARTSPLDKLRIVAALQERGHIVAVTGDGVNDAPALKRADVGVAMGKTGTEVAREAADMVLMDDNFATIVAAVEEGRVIFGNIRRFIGYVLTSNVPEILPYVAFVLLGIPLPLPVLLILAIDLGTDVAPAIGLATERAETDVMSQPPRPRSERLLSGKLLLSAYLLWGMFESAAGFAAYFWVLIRGGWVPGAELASSAPLYGQAIAAFFAAIVVCQVANILVWRTTRESVFKKGVLQNRTVVIGVAVELLLLVVIVATGIGHSIFGTVTPSLTAWLVPVPFALMMLIGAEIRKAIRRAAADAEAA